jgi:hypothetical protein
MVHFDDVKLLVGELGQLPPKIQTGLRAGFRIAGQTTLSVARGNAGWSSRIPGATSLRASTSARSAGVMLRVNAAAAPHARPYEGMGGRGSFRHPVYGNRNVWVTQATRPFLRPAVETTQSVYLRAAQDAVSAAAHASGFH